MEASPDAAERELLQDLASLEERFADERFSHELYQALASTVWTKEGLDAELAPSWSRAEELVNDLRDQFGHDPLVLAQTGGEGAISVLVADELGGLGWSGRPLDTGRDEEAHLDRDGAPPKTAGGSEWERQAHEEADRNRLERG